LAIYQLHELSMLLIEQFVYDPPPLGEVLVFATVCAWVPVEPVDTNAPAKALAETEPLPLCDAPAEACAEAEPAFAASAPHATPIANAPSRMLFVIFIVSSPLSAQLKFKALNVQRSRKQFRSQSMTDRRWRGS
jgi:hypothetical protein